MWNRMVEPYKNIENLKVNKSLVESNYKLKLFSLEDLEQEH